MKYIMFQQRIGSITRKIPIIFPDILTHIDVALAINPLLAPVQDSDVKIINAGTVNNFFCDSTTDKSVTLGLVADKNDSEIINSYDYFHGIVT